MAIRYYQIRKKPGAGRKIVRIQFALSFSEYLPRPYRAGRYWRLVSSQLSSLGGSMLYERENQIVVLNKTKLRPTVCGRDYAYEKDKFLKQDQLLADCCA